MLLLVLGAGASFDSIAPDVLARITTEDQEEWRPPLTQDLFGDRRCFEDVLNGLPQCAALVADLQRKLRQGANLEVELKTLQDEAVSYLPRHRELTALRLYLQETLWKCGSHWKDLSSGRTNYADLLRRVDKWRHDSDEKVCVATFNYDLLLDDAVTGQLGIGLDPIAGYVADEDWKYVKLHGSVNWGRFVQSPGGVTYSGWDHARRVLLDNAASLLEGKGDFVVRDPASPPSGSAALYFPAIAIPTETKAEFECPPSHLTALEQCIPRVDRILAIGWRGAEAHFLEKLRALPGMATPVLVVSDSESGCRETAQNLASSGLAKEAIGWFMGGFGGFLDQQRLENFLAATVPELRAKFERENSLHPGVA